MAAGADITDPVLVRFRQTLTETYGDRLERVVLFGSRARGDARPNSDYDVAVFLRDMHDRLRSLIGLLISARVSSMKPAMW